jgi:hypothetical protein
LAILCLGALIVVVLVINGSFQLDSSFTLKIQQIRVGRHLLLSTALSSDPKSIQPKRSAAEVTAAKYGQLRFLFFGTSRTYGSLLEDTSNAFPHLVAPSNGFNLGIPGGTAHYPSMCTYSMTHPVENGDAFDVIVLEYDLDGQFVVQLAQRLRHRYPEAHIVLVDMWKLDGYRTMKEANKTLGQWLVDHGIEVKKTTYSVKPSTAKYILTNTSPNDWFYQNHARFDRKMYENLEKLGVAVVKSQIPWDLHSAMRRSHYFVEDLHHFSVAGHLHVADQILRHLERINFRTQHIGTIQKWYDRDKCETWFQNGVTTMKYDKANIVMNKFTISKYALEVRGPQSWLNVTNNDSVNKQFVLDTMVAMPDCKYPAVEFSIVGSSEKPAVADCPKTSPYNRQVNIQTRINIGIIGHGESKILIRVLEDNKEWPFRITGMGLSSFQKVKSVGRS